MSDQITAGELLGGLERVSELYERDGLGVLMQTLVDAAIEYEREALAQKVEEHSEPHYVPHMKSAHRRAWRRGYRFARDIIRGGGA